MAVAGRAAQAFRARRADSRRAQFYKHCSCSGWTTCGSKLIAKAAARSVDEAQLLSAGDGACTLAHPLFLQVPEDVLWSLQAAAS